MEIQEKIISSLEELRSISGSWREFHKLNQKNNFCTSWSWLYLWCEHYLQNKDKLFVHIYYMNRQVIAIIPVYLKKLFYGFQLRFLGDGEPESVEVCSEFQDFIMAKQFDSHILDLFYKSVIREKRILSIVLNKISINSNASIWFENYFGNSKNTTKNLLGYRHNLAVQDNNNDQIGQIPDKTTRRQMRKYFNSTSCSIEFAYETNEVLKLFDTLKVIHNQLWKNKNKVGVFEHAIFNNFHQELMLQLLSDEKLVLFKLSYEQSVIAVFYGFISGSTLYYYQSGVVRNTMIPSAGSAMHAAALDIARSKGLKYYDLMMASKNSYKNKFVESNEKIYCLESFKMIFRFVKITELLKKLLK